MPVRYWPPGTTATEIAERVETAVRRGRLQPGDLLPAVRALAERNRVSPTTVAAAYRELTRRALARGDGRRGTRIAARPPLPSRPTTAVPEGRRDLATGNPDAALLADLVPALAGLGASQRPRRYGDSAELPELIAWARQQFSADKLPARDVAVVSGALDGVERVLGAHLHPGDRVVVEDPGYPPLFDLLAAFGAQPVAVAVDDSGLVAAGLRTALGSENPAALVVTPRAQNPTGAAFDRRRVTELRHVLAARPDLLLVEDDHAGPVAGVAPLTLASRRSRRWAIVRSVAKSLGPDLRVAVMTGDDETVARVRGRQQLGPGWVSHLLQELTVVLSTGREANARLACAAREYTRRRRALIAGLTREGISAHGRSGLNVWVPVSDEHAVVTAMGDAGYAVAPGARFRIRSAPAVRITIATLETFEAGDVAAAIASALRPRGGRST